MEQIVLNFIDLICPPAITFSKEKKKCIEYVEFSKKISNFDHFKLF